MLTQCPECKTTFRLNVAQLKAAAGKVRCSRCHTTFDALDNLCEAPAPNSQQTPPPAPPIPTDKPVTPEPAPVDNTNTIDIEQPLEEQKVEPSTTAPKEDTLALFINELEESTTTDGGAPPEPEGHGHHDAPLNSNILNAALDSVDDVFNTRDTEGEPSDTFEVILTSETVEEAEGLSPEESVVFFEESDDTLEEVLAVEETEELTSEVPEVLLEEPVETFDEVLAVEEAEELPSAEPEVLLEEPVETFDEVLAVEETEELPSEEPEVLLEEPVETFDEVLAVEETEELPQIEPDALLEEPAETFDEVLAVEETEELPQIEPEALLEESDDTFDEVLAVEETEELTSEEPKVPLEEPADTFDEVLTVEETEELPPVEPEVQLEEPVDTFDEALAVEETEELPQIEPEGLLEDTEETFEKIANNQQIEDEFEEDLDAFFEEHVSPEPTSPSVIQEQGELLPSRGEGSLNNIQDPGDTPAAESAVDPLSPFSEEQLENMLSPSADQVAEEAITASTDEHHNDILDLDTSDEITEIPSPTAPSTNDYAIPAELTQGRKDSGSSSILWGLGILLMCAILLLQYLYYFRLQLVDNPQLRPLLVRMCDVTGCELPPRRDLGRIELAERLMQFHPNYEQSLLISATLANRADFIQPYPLVEVVMTDIEQRVVARRHFTPKQYLPNYDGINHFPANSETPLMLEVLDPGNEAVGFEFRFY